ncbi:MAG TPA: tetratricopeptide repeat protein, partial [Allocoleopsis sp.]
KLGQITRDELYQQLQAVLQVLPSESSEQRSIAQALIRVDPPAPELLATYQALLPSNVPFLYFRIAQIQMQQNDLNAAKQTLAEYSATPTGKQDLAPDLLLAEIDRREGNLSKSADRYQTLLAANPKPEIYQNALRGLAGIRLAQGKLDEALSLYEQLLAANPDDLASQLGRASIGYQTGKTSEAEAEAILDRWLSTEPVPEPPPELFNLAGALPADPARQPLYEALLTIQPNDFAVNRRLVQVLAAIDPNQARQRVEQLVQNDPDNLNVYFVQGDLAQLLGDLSLASQAYETILAQQPDNVGALSALGGVRFQERRYQDAAALYNQVLALKPDDLETRRVLAELSAAQDQPIAALDQLQEVHQLQTEAGVSDPRIQQRIQQLEIDLLRRRGFQPEWERY